MAGDELASLRSQIAATDRELLAALNRRLELVRAVQAHKRDSGAPLIDAAREAELLDELVGANGGPLREQAVRSLFAAVLDVMKQEAGAVRREPAAAAPARSELAQHTVVEPPLRTPQM